MSEGELANWTMVLAAIVLVLGVWCIGKAQGLLDEAHKLRRETEALAREAEEMVDESLKKHDEITALRHDIMEELRANRLL